MAKDLRNYADVAENRVVPSEAVQPVEDWEVVPESEILLDPDFLLEELAGERNE